MKSIRRLGTYSAGLPLAADDLLEFHAARILLLLKFCGTANRIDGLTKLAKLDFFVRYPDFFTIACNALSIPMESVSKTVESSMIRFHYGPWDDRYYQVLGFLEARALISVTKVKETYKIGLTDKGETIAQELGSDSSYRSLTAQMAQVKKAFGAKAGSTLKKMIYEVFDREVGGRELGEKIL